MKLIMQHPHGFACKQACIAMLANRTLEEVINVAGSDCQIDISVRQRLFHLYGLGDADSSFAIETFGSRSLAALAKTHDTLLCSVYSWTEHGYAHAVILHRGQLYDPWHGMNPAWPWHRFVGQAMPVNYRGE